MPAHVDVLAGDVVDDFQESIRMPIGMDIRFEGAAVVCHAISFKLIASILRRTSHIVDPVALTYINCSVWVDPTAAPTRQVSSTLPA